MTREEGNFRCNLKDEKEPGTGLSKWVPSSRKCAHRPGESSPGRAGVRQGGREGEEPDQEPSRPCREVGSHSKNSGGPWGFQWR